MFLRLIWCVLLTTLVSVSSGQIVINEVLSSNNSGILDEDGVFTDWFELYNSSASPVNLDGYVIKDSMIETSGWTFPSVEIAPQSYLLVYASGKDRKAVSLHYKTIIKQGDTWHYLIPSGTVSGNWRMPEYNASAWLTGASGFGFGDDDDNTQLNITNSLYIRKEFEISDVNAVHKLIIHIDFDDAFLVTINGTLVASENVSIVDGDLDNVTATAGHEAVMYTGGIPTQYNVELSSELLREGTNVIAIQGYNSGAGSSDFTLIPFLTIGSDTYAVNDVADFILTEKGGLHTNFKIDNEGETLYLFNASNQLIDTAAIVSLPADVSYGRYKDGSEEWFYFPVSTPGGANLNPTSEMRSDSMIFSATAGFYPSPINLQLTTTTPNGEIRYTTDGSEPTIQSTLYSSQISIDYTTVVRAVSYLNGVKSSTTFSSTYFISPKHELPVISISTHPNNFFDYNEGILVEGPNAQPNDPRYGANYWMDWEKPVNMEYFDNEGRQKLNQGAGVKVTGNWSRMKPQKSMALFARKEYGKGSFEYPFFHDREFEKYESIILRNSGNDWESTMLRDGLVSEIAKDMDIDRLAYQPSVIYLNGGYWGILNMREKPNESYFESHYGTSEEKLNILEGAGGIIVGKNNEYLLMVNYLNKNSLVEEDKYLRIFDQIDVSCFIDYQILQIYIDNTDWPGNNIKFWKSDEVKSKWRWILFDTDFGLGLFGAGASHNGISFATEPNGPSWPNPSWSTLLLRRMLTNESFKNRFINRMADCMNSYFNSSVLYEKLDSVAAVIDPEIEAHQVLWGRSYSQWKSNLNQIRLFVKNRPNYMRTHFLNYFELDRNCIVDVTVSGEEQGSVQVSTIHPTSYPFSGSYFSNVPVPFKALPKEGYRFVRWENASTATNSAIQLTLTGNISLHAVFEKVENAEPNVVINEINYKSDSIYDSGEWIELFNPTDFTISLEGWMLSDAALASGYVFQPGQLLYPRSYLVVCGNEMKFKQIHTDVKNVIGEFVFGLSSLGDVITLTDPLGNIVDYVVYKTSAPWPTAPLITASTLHLLAPNIDNSIPESWAAGPLGGTPGAPNGIITEIDKIEQVAQRAFCFPNRFFDYTTLSVYSPEESSYSIQILDIQGRTLYKNEGQFDHSGTYYINLFADGNSYQKGVYLVHVKTKVGTETLKVVKQ